MKITIVTAFFEPEITANIPLISDLCRDWELYGARVTVLTEFPSRGIDKQTRIEYLDKTEEYIAANLKIRRVGLKSAEGTNFILRGLRHLYQTYVLYRNALKLETDVYFIVSSPPFLGIAGALLSKKAPTVYNLQDIFPDSLINTGKYTEKSMLVKICRKLEQFIYRNNTHILTISEDFKQILLNRFVPNSKISLVYNWIDEKAVLPIERKDNQLFSRYGLDPEKFYLTYCGNIGYSQNLEMIVDIAYELGKEIADMEFLFIGDGGWKSTLESYIKGKGVRNVRMLPFQPYEDISHVMSLGDASLVCSKKNVGSSSFPSKTWSIMSAARPVIASFDLNSELCTIINKANAGLFSDAEDKKGLKENILKLYYDRQKAVSLGQNGRMYIKNNLTRKTATKQYFDVLSEIAQKGTYFS